MASTTPTTAIRHQLRERLQMLPPRAFELFAGDLLAYIGLQSVAVTRYVGDGGIDASGELVSGSGLIRVPTGVQVKRYRQNVQRTDIDRFIGALSGRYHHGIFITTAEYSQQARQKAHSSPMIRIDTVGGEAMVNLMHEHQLGLNPQGDLDEAYFAIYESQVRPVSPIEAPAPVQPGAIKEETVIYEVPPAPVDLISLRALSYMLRVDQKTVRGWIERGQLAPDQHSTHSYGEGFFFRRDRVEEICALLARSPRPTTGDEWRLEFLKFAQSRNLTKSYKPVLMKALIQLVNRQGEVALGTLVSAFHAFYLARHQQGLAAEYGVKLLADPSLTNIAELRRLIIRFPLDRFIIQGFLEYDAASDMVRFEPTLWAELRARELLDVLAHADEQLRYYYARSES